MNRSIYLGKIPFYWGMRDNLTENPDMIPEFLPFELIFNESLQLFQQKASDYINECLQKVYLHDSNAGYLQEGHALAELYGGDFLEFMDTILQKRPGLNSCLEIGCGGGYLMKKLKDRGYDVMGVDPSPVAVRKAKEFGIIVMKDFYPVNSKPGRWASGPESKKDCIYHYDVLEHVADPVEFLKAHKNELKPDGIVIMAVPDCSQSNQRGDISMVLHEHINYFDEESLRITIEAAGFDVLQLRPSKKMGVLYAAAQWLENKEAKHPSPLNYHKFEKFFQGFHNILGNLQEFLAQGRSEKTTGIYVPLRMIPYLAILRIFNGIRFFDDDPEMRNKYFNGFDIPVENIDQLVEEPVDRLVIASFSFASIIEKKVRERLGQSIEIKYLADFM